MPIQELWTPRDEDRVGTFARSVRRGDLEGALFAIEGADADAVRDACAELDRLAREVRASRRSTPEDAAAALAQTFSTAGFRGDVETYYSPRNSQLAAVITGRRGLPILLSLVWMLVGSRSGVVVEGIGLPGHFIARVGGRDGVLVDPFDGGRPLSIDDCRTMVARISGGRTAWRDDMLRATSDLAILERVLRNLVTSHARERDLVSLYRLSHLWIALRPDAIEPYAHRAFVAEQLGAGPACLDAYRAIVTTFPGTPDAIRAAASLEKAKRSATLN